MLNEDEEFEIHLEPDGFADMPQIGHPFTDFVVLLSQSVVQQIREHTESHLDHEMGGMLLGEVWEHNGTTYVDIRETIPSQIQGTYATLSFTVETWLDLERQHKLLFPNYKKLGWYHSHLGYGVFLSPLDTFLHTYAFSLPWHVALVYDPVLSKYGVFRWRDEEIVPTQFYITSQNNIYEEISMSETISQRLQVLSNYLETLPLGNAIATAAQRIHSRLQYTIREAFTPLTPVEDTLATIIEIAKIDVKSLQQARHVLKGVLGQQLFLGQNIHFAASALFKNEKFVVSQQQVYFIEGKDLFWFPLGQESALSVISAPSALYNITANHDSIFALDQSGIIYILPNSTMLRFINDEEQHQKLKRGLVHVELKSITLSSKDYEPFEAIAANNNTLYVSTKTSVCIIELESATHPLSTKFFSLSSIKGEIPVEVAGLAVDREGNIYLSDATNSRVLQMQPNGRIELSFIGDGRHSLVQPSSLCVSKHELYVLDLSIQYIIVYNLETKRYERHYSWGEFVADRAIQHLYADETGRVYFSAGKRPCGLYYLDESRTEGQGE